MESLQTFVKGRQAQDIFNKDFVTNIMVLIEIDETYQYRNVFKVLQNCRLFYHPLICKGMQILYPCPSTLYEKQITLAINGLQIDVLGLQVNGRRGCLQPLNLMYT